MRNVLTRKLELFCSLPGDDRFFLDQVVAKALTVGPGRDLVREGEPLGDVPLLLSGFAFRYKMVQGGSRQILGFLLPGDFHDLHGFILKAADHSIATVSACTVARISPTRVLEMSCRPTLARALWWATLVESAIGREWLVNLGRRNAEQRLAHLFCELHLRLERVGLTEDRTFAIPLTQADLGDAVGLSTVHVNRSIQSLRRQNLISFRSGRLEILDIGQLREICGFRANYLHIENEAALSPEFADV